MTAGAEDRFPFTPLVVIGAGRSGTNALRGQLEGCGIPGLGQLDWQRTGRCRGIPGHVYISAREPMRLHGYLNQD